MHTIRDNWTLYNGDNCKIMSQFPESSIDYSLFSPPFIDLYTYSDSVEDMGNSKNKNQFDEHFSFFAKEIFRIIRIGRLVSVHCTQVPAMKERDGYLGLKDFRGDIIRLFQSVGFWFHSEVTIWKNPLIEATRTKALGLLHKQLCKDSSECRQGLCDYILTFRKPGKNEFLISHEDGLNNYEYFGNNEIKETGIKKSHETWRQYASPIWLDIRQTRTLNSLKSENDEKHICPLQLDTIGRCLVLWSNPGDVVLDPFNGIGSVGYQSIQLNRKYIGVELKKEYYDQSIINIEKAERLLKKEVSLFDEV